MTSFWVISIIILMFPLILFLVGYLNRTLKFNLPHIVAMTFFSLAWLFFQYRELTCVTKECIEWKVSANGGVLVIHEIFPLIFLIILIPWFFVILKHIRNKVACNH